ncbi:PfkB family carbohydrate kinase [uncultured Roseibium sp.]|uniref:PfkB family carbohydrate kinase n=1 Tax=uncultured Roseibium sp. TaxID=1936171 RepID=UPI002598BFDA|nr:PfkB family carbohydrate kinase [uncultured Roseibium sp.]
MPPARPQASPPHPIACFGAVHWDIIAHADRPILRDTSTPADLDQKPGGVATNVARVLARLGVPTTLIGVTGADPAAASIRAQLERDGVEPHLLERSGQATGQYLALHNPDGGLAAACINDKVLTSAPADFFIETARQMPDDALWFVDANLPVAILDALAEVAPKAALVADAVSVAKAPRLRSLLPKLELLLLNRAEATALLDASADTPAENLSEELLSRGVGAVVITSGHEPLHMRNSGQSLDHAPPPASIVDVTGAGDALIAGTLAGLARGFELDVSLQIGQKAALETLQASGAVADTLSWSAIHPD